MKRFLALVALVLGLVACQTEPEGLDVIVGGEVDTVVSVSLPEATRADSAEGFDLATLGGKYNLRYILEVYLGDNCQRHVLVSDNTSVAFPVRLAPGRDYKLVVWADIVQGNSEADRYYNTTKGLDEVTIIESDEIKWNAMNETRDAFTATQTVSAHDIATGAITMTLERPFAKLRVVATDYDDVVKLGLAPASAVVTYSQEMPRTYNALNATPVFTSASSKSHTITYPADTKDAVYSYKDGEYTLFADYFFVPETGTAKFEFDVNTATDSRIKYTNFNTEIFVEANKLTTIKGDVLTTGANINIGIEDNGAMDTPAYEYKTISSKAELLTAIENGGEYIVISNFEVNGSSISTLAATRTTSTTTPTIINLNGYTITLKADVEIPAGKTVIINNDPVDNDNNELGAVVSAGGKIVNEGKLNIEGGAFGANTIKNNNGEVNITGGTFASDPSEFVDDDYKVVENEENGEFTIERKPDIVMIGEVGYTSLIKAAAAVQDGETITLLADETFTNKNYSDNGGWKDGLYYVGDKSFTIDLNGKTIGQNGDLNDYLLNFKNVGSKANTITLKNGTLDAGKTAYCALCTSSSHENQLTINTENITITNNISNGSTVRVRGGAILNVKTDTKIIGQDSYLGIECAASTVNIYDGVEIYMNGTSSYNGCLAGACYGGTINVYGGYGKGVKGGFIAMTSGGTINVSGGEWIANTDGTIGDNSNLYVLTAQSNKNESGFVGGAYINVTGGTFRGGMDAWVLNNVEGEEAKLSISGGNFNANPSSHLAEGYVVDEEDGIYSVVKDVKVAKVGNTEYRKIDDAIAAWTNNTTLTLLSDVTLTDVVNLNSTEHHILDLGTYTLTAAEGKNAFVIKACGTGDAERTAITIKADATNPGGINAGKKCIVYYKYADGGISGNDRPIIKIEGGVFNGSTSSLGTYGIHTIGSEARKCATLNISGGTFNCSIYGSSKSKLLISGGLFHYSVGSQGDSTALRLISGGTFKTLGFMTADSNNTKFWFGTSMGNSNVGLYINDDNYLVVGGPVITEFGDKFAAKATNPTKWSSYLQYSSAAEHGLYYTNADMAIKKHGEDNVVLK